MSYIATRDRRDRSLYRIEWDDEDGDAPPDPVSIEIIGWRSKEIAEHMLDCLNDGYFE